MRTHRRGQRYERGQKVYIRGWGVLDTATVTGVLTIRGWPYYEVLATNDASVWLVAAMPRGVITIDRACQRSCAPKIAERTIVRIRIGIKTLTVP